MLYWDGYDDEDFYVCIDISTAEMKEVTQKDSEKIYFGMIGAWEKPGTTGEWKPRERKEPDQKGPDSSSFDISPPLYWHIQECEYNDWLLEVHDRQAYVGKNKNV